MSKTKSNAQVEKAIQGIEHRYEIGKEVLRQCGQRSPHGVITELAEKHGVPLIADEIYQDMVYDGESKSFGELSEHVPVLSCCGLAKRFIFKNVENLEL